MLCRCYRDCLPARRGVSALAGMLHDIAMPHDPSAKRGRDVNSPSHWQGRMEMEGLLLQALERPFLGKGLDEYRKVA